MGIPPICLPDDLYRLKYNLDLRFESSVIYERSETYRAVQARYRAFESSVIYERSETILKVLPPCAPFESSVIYERSET